MGNYPNATKMRLWTENWRVLQKNTGAKQIFHDID